jgi:hypothetical protein
MPASLALTRSINKSAAVVMDGYTLGIDRRKEGLMLDKHGKRKKVGRAEWYEMQSDSPTSKRLGDESNVEGKGNIVQKMVGKAIACIRRSGSKACWEGTSNRQDRTHHPGDMRARQQYLALEQWNLKL